MLKIRLNVLSTKQFSFKVLSSSLDRIASESLVRCPGGTIEQKSLNEVVPNQIETDVQHVTMSVIQYKI